MGRLYLNLGDLLEAVLVDTFLGFFAEVVLRNIPRILVGIIFAFSLTFPLSISVLTLFLAEIGPEVPYLTIWTFAT